MKLIEQMLGERETNVKVSNFLLFCYSFNEVSILDFRMGWHCLHLFNNQIRRNERRWRDIIFPFFPL